MPQQINIDRLVWVDLETFGLDPETCPVLEVGFKITDRGLNVTDDFQATIWETYFQDEIERIKTTNSYVYQMHNTSHPGMTALFKDAPMSGLSEEEVSERLVDWLTGHGIDKGDALCGSSVAFDRGFLKENFSEAEDMFSYRNFDVSTIKEACARFNPELYARLEEATDPKKYHRVLPDLDDTIAEFEFYRREFLICDDGSSDYGD